MGMGVIPFPRKNPPGIFDSDTSFILLGAKINAYERAGCFGTGPQCGGWGHVVVKMTAAPKAS
jgi:hypothetical protein